MSDRPRGRPPKYGARTVQLGSVRLRPDTLAWVDAKAAQENVSRATWVTRLLECYQDHAAKKAGVAVVIKPEDE